jgi:hypothetical protein
MCLVFLDHPNSIKASQKVRDRGRVTVRCEVGEKIWGYRARKFIRRSIRKASLIIPFLLFSLFFRVNETSLLRILKIFCFALLKVAEMFQIFVVVTRGVAKSNSQAIENKEELGSNMENKFIIMLWGFLFLLWPKLFLFGYLFVLSVL